METVWVSCGVDAGQWTMTIAAALAVVLAGYYQKSRSEARPFKTGTKVGTSPLLPLMSEY